MFSNNDVVFAYTRKDAIADGIQIALSEKFSEACRGFKVPVFCTSRVWELIESAVNNPKTVNDFSGVIGDICWMSGHSPGRKAIANGAGVEFTVIVNGASITPDDVEAGMPLYRLQAICGPMDIDDPNPAITLMFSNED